MKLDRIRRCRIRLQPRRRWLIVKTDDKRIPKSIPMTKMMVTNLSAHTTVESLNSLFAEFGIVRSVSLATDIMTGRCGGFGFVSLGELNVGAALCALDGQRIDGRVLHVAFEQKRAQGGALIQDNRYDS